MKEQCHITEDNQKLLVCKKCGCIRKSQIFPNAYYFDYLNYLYNIVPHNVDKSMIQKAKLRAQICSDYFKENSYSRLYPKDHWLHENEEFDSKMSKQFEKNGFGWTENGGLWKIGLSNEQANAEVRLAQVNQQQQEILAREQAIVENLRE